VEIKTYQLQELVKLWEQGYIDLRFGDESHVCTSGYVPYGWHFEGEDVFVPSQGKHRLNIFGMVSPNCLYDGFDTEDSITGERLAAFLDDFSIMITKPTVIVLDNAAIHRKGEVAKMREKWKERGLYLFFLPPYCPHLNIAETLWRVLKGKWMQPYHYCNRNILHETTREILAGIGTTYIINFPHAA
jgi:transposase